MKQYLILTDASDNSVYGIAIKSAETLHVRGAHKRASEWASWVNTKSPSSLDGFLPPDIVASQPYSLKSDSESFLDGLVEALVEGSVPSISLKSYIESESTNVSSSTPTIRDYALSSFDISGRQGAIDFKALAFKSDVKSQSLHALIRTGKAALDVKTGLIRSRIKDLPSSELQAKLDSSISRSAQRAVGLEATAFRQQVAESAVEKKKLGARIGRGLRSAPPGFVFVDVTGTIDADKDGIVFEGKPGLERPIIPRFTIPESLARRFSDLIQGDAEANENLRKAGKLNEAESLSRIRKLVSDSATPTTPRPQDGPSVDFARRAIIQQRTGRSRFSRVGRGEKTQFDIGNSRAVEKLSWDDSKNELIVTFNGGRTYTYKDVDSRWVDEIENNPDALGRILNNIKKEGYSFERGGKHAPDSTLGTGAQRQREAASMRSARQRGGKVSRGPIWDVSSVGQMDTWSERRGYGYGQAGFWEPDNDNSYSLFAGQLKYEPRAEDGRGMSLGVFKTPEEARDAAYAHYEKLKGNELLKGVNSARSQRMAVRREDGSIRQGEGGRYIKEKDFVARLRKNGKLLRENNGDYEVWLSNDNEVYFISNDLSHVSNEAQRRFAENAEMVDITVLGGEDAERYLKENRIDITALPEPQSTISARSSRSSAATESLPTELLAEISSATPADLARLIRKDLREQGKPVPFGAAPYLDALSSMESLDDNYGFDTGRSVASYLLSNLQQYRGPKAKEIKKELKKRINAKPGSPTSSRSSRYLSFMSDDDISALGRKHFGDELVRNLASGNNESAFESLSSSMSKLRADIIGELMVESDGKIPVLPTYKLEDIFNMASETVVLGGTNLDDLTKSVMQDYVLDEQMAMSDMLASSSLLARSFASAIDEASDEATKARLLSTYGDVSSRSVRWSPHPALPYPPHNRVTYADKDGIPRQALYINSDSMSILPEGEPSVSGAFLEWMSAFPEADHRSAADAYQAIARVEVERLLARAEAGQIRVSPMPGTDDFDEPTFISIQGNIEQIRKDTTEAMELEFQAIDSYARERSKRIKKSAGSALNKRLISSQSKRGSSGLDVDALKNAKMVQNAGGDVVPGRFLNGPESHPLSPLSSRSSNIYNGQSISGGTMPSWSDLSGMRKISGPLGSNGGQWYEDSRTGRTFFVKPTPTAKHAHNEAAVAAVYRATGVAAPNVVVTTDGNGKTHIISEAIPSLTTTSNLSDREKRLVKADMGIDMLLSNWDVFGGGENTKKSSSGLMYRLDTGGGGMFRARGGDKPSFNPSDPWIEPATMVYSSGGQSQRLYGRVSNGDFAFAMDRVANIDLPSIDREMKDAGIPGDIREHFIATLSARQQLARGYVDTFSKYEPDARVDVRGTAITPGGNRLPEKSKLRGLLSSKSMRRNGSISDAQRNVLLASDSPEQSLFVERFDDGPSGWSNLDVLPNTLALLKQKRQMQFNRLVDEGMDRREAAELVLDAHVRSHMRGRITRDLTQSGVAAYAEYAMGYDTLLEEIDGWPQGSLATAEMTSLRQVDRYSQINDFFSSLGSGSSRSVRWTASTKGKSGRLRDDVDGEVVLRGREGNDIRVEVLRTPQGRFIISGVERDDDGSMRAIGSGVADRDSDLRISDEFDSLELAAMAVDDYVDGPDVDIDDDYRDADSLSSYSTRKAPEIQQMRASIVDEDGNLVKPMFGFTKADYERMSDKQLLENAWGMSASLEDSSIGLQYDLPSQKGDIWDEMYRRGLVSGRWDTPTKESYDFDGFGSAISRATGERVEPRLSARSSRIGSKGNTEMHLTFSQLSALDRDAQRAGEILPDLLKDTPDREELLEAFDEFTDAINNAILAVDAVVVSNQSMSRLSAIAEILGEEGIAKIVQKRVSRGDKKDIVAFEGLAALINRAFGAPDGVFVSSKLDENGSMFDMDMEIPSRKERFSSLVRKAIERRRNDGFPTKPSYIESRSRRSNNARREGVIADAFAESDEFDSYFDTFKRTLANPEERRRRGIELDRDIDDVDYINSPEFRDDMRRWDAEKLADAEKAWLDDYFESPYNRSSSALDDAFAASGAEDAGFANFIDAVDRGDVPGMSSRSKRNRATREDYLLSGRRDQDIQMWAESRLRNGDSTNAASRPGTATRPASGVRTSGVKRQSPSARRRMATIEQSSSMSSRSTRPGHEKAVDTDGKIWSLMTPESRDATRERLIDIEDSLIRELSGGATLYPRFDDTGKLVDLQAQSPDNEGEFTGVLKGRGNENVGLYGILSDLNFYGSTLELERTPKTEKEKQRLAKLERYPLLQSVPVTNSDGTVEYRLGLSPRALKSLDVSYVAVRKELMNMLDGNDDSTPAGKVKRKNILKELALLDDHVSALKTIATARLLSGESGRNADGGDAMEYVPEQLPSSVRKAIFQSDSRYSPIGRVKRDIFDTWRRSKTNQKGKKIRKGSKDYNTLLEKFENGELDQELFDWWKGLTPKQISNLGIKSPDGYFDENGNLLPRYAKSVDVPSGVDLDAPGSHQKLGEIVPGKRKDDIKRSGASNSWSNFWFRFTRPNNKKWLERKQEADERRLGALKAGKGAYGGERDEVEKSRKELRILRKRRAERLALLKDNENRGSEKIKSLHDEKMAQRVDLITTSDDGEVSVSDEAIEHMSNATALKGRRVQSIEQAENETPEQKKRREKVEKEIRSRNKQENKALAFWWEKAGYNERPTVLSEDEFMEEAAKPGAIVVRRGIGGKTFAEEYMDDDNRFTTGQAGQVQGPGEYWAIRVEDGKDVRGSSSQWDGYVNADKQGGRPNTEPGAGGVVAILPADAKTIPIAEIRQIRQDIARASGGLKLAIDDPSLPKAAELKFGASSDELLELMKANLFKLVPQGDPLWDTTAGKMIMQLYSRALNASNATDRTKALEALEYLIKGTDGHLSNLLAPILGFDAIIADSGVVLVMNRGALLTFGGVGGLTMTNAVERALIAGERIPDEMARKLANGDRVD